MVNDTSVDEVINNFQDTTIEPDVLEVPEKVIYAITNEDGHITQLVSSVFASKEQLAVGKPIAYGNGDNFVHVGEYITNVLGKELMDEDFCANFKLFEIAEDDGDRYSIVERTREEKDKELANRPKPEVPPVQDVIELAKAVQQTSQTVDVLEGTTQALTDALVEVDEKVQEAQTTTEALTHAIVEVDEKTTQSTETVDALTDAMIEVDEKTAEATETVQALTAALVEVDEKMAQHTEDRNEDIKVLMAAVVELSEELAALKEQLGIKDTQE